MKRRTVNGYSENEVRRILENREPPKSHTDFWEAFEYFFQNSIESEMSTKQEQEHHRQLMFEAQRHCEEHFGVWTQEDEEELEFVSTPFYGESGSEYNPLLGMSDEEWLRRENRKENDRRQFEQFDGFGQGEYEDD